MPRALRVGDRVRLIRTPPIWENAGHRVPRELKRLYRRLVESGRRLRVDEIDEFGTWVRFGVRERDRGVGDHTLVLDDGCWVKVVPRRR